MRTKGKLRQQPRYTVGALASCSNPTRTHDSSLSYGAVIRGRFFCRPLDRLGDSLDVPKSHFFVGVRRNLPSPGELRKT